MAATNSRQVDQMATILESSMVQMNGGNLTPEARSQARAMAAALASQMNILRGAGAMGAASGYDAIYEGVISQTGGISVANGLGGARAGYGTAYGAGDTAQAIAEDITQMVKARNNTSGSFNLGGSVLNERTQNELMGAIVKRQGLHYGDVQHIDMGYSSKNMREGLKAYQINGGQGIKAGEQGHQIAKALAVRELMDVHAKAQMLMDATPGMSQDDALQAARAQLESDKANGIDSNYFQDYTKGDIKRRQDIISRIKVGDKDDVLDANGNRVGVTIDKQAIFDATQQSMGAMGADTVSAQAKDKMNATFDHVQNTIKDLQEMFGVESFKDLQEKASQLNLGSMAAEADVKRARSWMEKTKTYATVMNMDVKEVIEQQSYFAAAMPHASAERVLYTQRALGYYSNRKSNGDDLPYTEEEEAAILAENAAMDDNDRAGLYAMREVINRAGHLGMKEDSAEYQRILELEQLMSTEADPEKLAAYNNEALTLLNGRISQKALEEGYYTKKWQRDSDIELGDEAAAAYWGNEAGRQSAKDLGIDASQAGDMFASLATNFGSDKDSIRSVIKAAITGDFSGLGDDFSKQAAQQLIDSGVAGNFTEGDIDTIVGAYEARYLNGEGGAKAMGLSRYERHKSDEVMGHELLVKASEAAKDGPKSKGAIGDLIDGLMGGKYMTSPGEMTEALMALSGADKASSPEEARDKLLARFGNDATLAEGIKTGKIEFTEEGGQLTEESRASIAAMAGMSAEEAANMSDAELLSAVRGNLSDQGMTLQTVGNTMVAMSSKAQSRANNLLEQEKIKNAGAVYVNATESQKDNMIFGEHGELLGYRAKDASGNDIALTSKSSDDDLKKAGFDEKQIKEWHAAFSSGSSVMKGGSAVNGILNDLDKKAAEAQAKKEKAAEEAQKAMALNTESMANNIAKLADACEDKYLKVKEV